MKIILSLLLSVSAQAAASPIHCVASALVNDKFMNQDLVGAGDILSTDFQGYVYSVRIINGFMSYNINSSNELEIAGVANLPRGGIPFLLNFENKQTGKENQIKCKEN